MYKLFFLLCCLLCRLVLVACIPPKAIDPRLAVLKQAVLKDILATAVAEKEVNTLATTMKEDGSWPDINYADKTRGGWTVNDHLTRLYDMAVIYKKNGSRLTNDPTLEKKIIHGLDYWLKNDFICPNWWYPQIGVPKVLAPVMLLMENKLSPEQVAAGVKILERAKIGMTGQNKVWLSGNVIYRSLLTGDLPAVEAAVKAIQDEIVVSEGEGIQADYSFHQHGTQQQFGNYGSAYAADMLKWGSIFQQTAFRFDAGRIIILRKYLLDGMRWITWKNKMDISACGRQLFPGAQAGKANSLQRILDKMPVVDPPFTVQYKTAMDDFSGNNHFWKSDMTVHRRNDFYVSVKMSSRRVGGAESCNEENIQGYHLGDGATYFYQSNNEYTDIFPYWDWKMIPGTTAFYDEAPLPALPCSGYNIASDFVGGLSDGANGIATLAYHRDSLHAGKAWFFFEDAIVCLGAGIQTTENKEVRTTLNQSFLKGTVSVKQGGNVKPLQEGLHQLGKTSWVLHDNWGYFFPLKTDVQLRNEVQDGSWHRVLKRMPDSTLRASIFTLWLSHGSQPDGAGYAYYVLPHATEKNIESRAAALTVTYNTTKLQVVEDMKNQRTGLVFTAAATASTKNFGTITADKPSVIMLTKKYAATELAVADPTHQLTNMIISVSGNKKATGIEARYDKEKNKTFFSVVLPQGADAGKTVLFTMKQQTF